MVKILEYIVSNIIIIINGEETEGKKAKIDKYIVNKCNKETKNFSTLQK
jgi:hypothetical protein